MQPRSAGAGATGEQFKRLRASELFCPRCRQAMPVREFLLLVLPAGELYEYRCARCSESLGKRTVAQQAETSLILP